MALPAPPDVLPRWLHLAGRELRGPELSFAEQKEQYKLWYRIIPPAEFPAEIVEAAFIEHMKVCKWFPKPAEIRCQADRLLDLERRTLARLKQLLAAQHQQDLPKDAPKHLTPEQIEFRRKQCAQWRRQYGFGNAQPQLHSKAI